MQRRRKAQVAMEFLMTYGWAILIVLTAIAALSYFGVLDLSRFLPERCNFPVGLDCLDKPALDTSNGVMKLALKNNLGFDIEIQNDIDGTDDCNTVASANLTIDGVPKTLPLNVTNNDQFIMNIDCGDISEGPFRTDITFTYNNYETGLTHKIAGSIRGNAN
ncbi:hypothetical protein HYW21_08130 [Candidatus Woesearchaeota archaeon]|nr:hypothetical protein [Candidatus Woesearchaeota archaeon]